MWKGKKWLNKPKVCYANCGCLLDPEKEWSVLGWSTPAVCSHSHHPVVSQQVLFLEGWSSEQPHITHITGELLKR